MRKKDEKFIKGQKGRETYKTFSLTADEKKKLDVHYQKLEARVKPKSNQLLARYLFHAKEQEGGEKFENFVTELKLLFQDCGYQQGEEMVRDKIVFGVRSSKVRARMIQQDLLWLVEKDIDIGRTMKVSEAQ